MQHPSKFKSLLEDTVNLPDGKLQLLSTRVEAIFAAIKAADTEVAVVGKKRQGSWAQRTIINPPKDVEFDADFMLELEEMDGWSPADYNRAAHQALADHAVYGSMVEAKNRCVRVTYANDMHVDVVPYVNLEDGGEHIINAETDEWEANDSDGFTKWMKEKDDIANGNMRRVIRLLKYLRDHCDWYDETVSIILTTVVGNTIDEAKVLDNADCYANVPLTLGRVVADLSDWAKANPTIPTVEANDGTTFEHRWEDHQYQQFRTDIQALNTKIAAALKETDEAQSLALWRDLFGTGFKSTTSTAGQSTKFPSTGAGAAAAATGVAAGRSGKAG
jgi:hypothetical protein